MANQKSIACSSSGDNTVFDVSTITRWQMFEYVLTAASNCTVIVKDEATTEYGRYQMLAGIPVTAPPIAGGNRFVAKGDLILNVSSGTIVTGHFVYSGTDAS